MHERPLSDAAEATLIPLVDVTSVSLRTLLDSEQTVLGNAVRRLLLEIDSAGENYAAHSTAI